MIFSRRPNLKQDIDNLAKQISEIESLKETTQTLGWKSIRQIIETHIAAFTQSVFDLSDNPEKNAAEIRARRLTADSMGRILASIDNKVVNEQFLRDELNKKAAVLRSQGD